MSRFKRLLSTLLVMALMLGVLPNNITLAVTPPADGTVVELGAYRFTFNTIRYMQDSGYDTTRVDPSMMGWGAEIISNRLTEYPPLPAEVDGFPVKHFLGYVSCQGITNLDWLDLPSSLTGRIAFSGNYKLVDVDIDLSHITDLKVMRGAFKSCSVLESVKMKLPDSITDIGYLTDSSNKLVNIEFNVPTSVINMERLVSSPLVKDYSKIKFYDYDNKINGEFMVNTLGDDSIIWDKIPASLGINFTKPTGYFDSKEHKFPTLYNGKYNVVEIVDTTLKIKNLSGSGFSNKYLDLDYITDIEIEGGGLTPSWFRSNSLKNVTQGYVEGGGMTAGFKADNLTTVNTCPDGGEYKNLIIGEGVEYISGKDFIIHSSISLPSTLKDFFYARILVDGKNTATIITPNGLPNLTTIANSGGVMKGFNWGQVTFGPQVEDLTGIKPFSGTGAIKVYKNTYASSFMSNKVNNPNLQYVELDIVEPGSVTINPSQTTINVGDNKKLTANVRPTTTVNKLVKWNSLNTSVATVDASGLVTGKTAGQAYIVATTSNGLEAECLVTVKTTIPVTDITVPTSINVEVNKSKVVSVTTLPAWADVPTLDITSADDSIALIKDGKVWGVSEGSTTITVKCGAIVKTIAVSVVPNTGGSDGGTGTGAPVEMDPIVKPTIPTNKSIDIPLNIVGDVEYIELPNGNKYYGDLDKYSVFENGFYSFTVYGKDGSKSSQSVVVTNIDKEAPMLTFSYGVDFKSVFIKAYDNVAVKRIDVPKTSLSVDGSELTYPLTDATSYGTVVVTDTTGNYSSKDISINSIGSGGSGGTSVTYYALENIPIDWTNKDVTIKAAAFNQDGLAKSISIDNGTKSTSKARSKPALFTTKDISSNGTFTLRVTGTDNSEATKNFTVDKIDKAAPTLSLSEVGGIVSYTATDDLSGIKAIELPDGSIQEVPSDGIKVKSGTIGLSHGTISLKVRDYAGNATTSSITIGSNPVPPINPDGGSGGSGGSGGGGGGTGTPESPIVKPETPADAPEIGSDKDGNQLELNKDIKVNKDTLVNGFVEGYTTNEVKAVKPITRAEFVVMLDRIISSSASYDVKFNDVNKDWYKDQIKRMSSIKLVIGNGKGDFMPDKYITREDVATVLSRIVLLSKYKAESPLVDINESYAKNEISRLYNAGIISGDEIGNFKPKDNITRAESVTMLNRVFLNENARLKDNKFTDLSEDDWYYTNILKAIIES